MRVLLTEAGQGLRSEATCLAEAVFAKTGLSIDELRTLTQNVGGCSARWRQNQPRMPSASDNAAAALAIGAGIACGARRSGVPS